MERKDLIQEYKLYINRKIWIILSIAFGMLFISFYALNAGSYSISLKDVIRTILGRGDERLRIIIWDIRIPRIIGAVVAGIGLSLAGCISQNILRNPLASPFTLGISQGAAFGATLAITMISKNIPYLVPLFAFWGSMLATFVIIILSINYRVTPEAMVLSGVALGSLFSALTTILQYFADEVKIATVVFWTFGDLGRISWRELTIMTISVFLSFIYFMFKRWDYNTLESGEETAKSLGINVERERIISMLISSFISAVVTASCGVIGFIGLISPHIMRRFVGNDYRFLIPASGISGGVLLLLSDTLARTIISPIVLPVGAITSFLGAPFFLYLLSKRYRR
uniref:Iron ABC transporter permease n=1 Tax=Dictyoglomus thermophilum TaxID=14 RepID=A0A7C3RWP6_DICTH